MRSKSFRWVVAGLLLLCLCIIVGPVNAVSPILLKDKIAFFSDRDVPTNLEIYVMNGDGTGALRLTYSPGNDMQPSWSPDRKKIVFVSDRDGNDEIYVMDANGANPTRLTNNQADDYNPAWSPDGTKIAFASEPSGGNWDIYVMDANGANPAQLTSNPAIDVEPAWSPDGTKIAFASERGISGTHDIYVMNALNGETGGLTQLTSNPAIDAGPAWSPDGNQIAFYSSRGVNNNNEIYVMDALNGEAGGLTRLTIDLADDSEPAWSPSGLIAFESTRDGNVEIYTMDPNNPVDLIRLTKNQAVDGGPAYAPVPAIIADFTWTRSSSSITFTDTSLGSPELWSWVFGDGGGSASQSPTHTYSTPGTYTVSLTVTDSGGVSDKITKDVSTIPGAIIGQGATIFIGESGLDIAPALKATGNSIEIAHWASWPPNPLSPNPDKIIVIADITPKNFFVDPSVFAGYTGTWRDWDHRLQGSDALNLAMEYPVFDVADPSLAIKTINLDTNGDVSGKTVARGTRLGFDIETNMWPAVDAETRSPIDYSTDGYIDIKVKTPDGAVLTSLYSEDIEQYTSPYPIVNNFIDGQPWTWGSADYGWQTGALDGLQPLYQAGTYTISAESTLHNMKDNYNVVGKTVTATHTITILVGGLTVTGITPASGFNTGSVSITNLAGTGFVSGASVKLTRAGQTDITATGVTVVSPTQITCTLPVTGAAAGLWNVVVTNPDLQTGTLPSGFAVTTPQQQNDAYKYLLQSVPSDFPGGTLPSGTAMSVSDTQLAPKSKVHQWGDLSEPRFHETGNHWFWIFMYDPTPKKNFEHLVKYFFVNKNDMTIEEYDAHTPPSGIPTRVIGGEVQVSGTSTVTATGALSTTNSLSVGGTFLTGATLGAGVMSVTPSCNNLDCTHCYALLISGGVEPARNYARYWTDMSNMYLNLTRYPYCYPEDHIYVLMSDGTASGPSDQDRCATTNCASYISSSPDLDGDTQNEPHYGAATVSNLVSTFATIRSLLNADPQSTLFIFTTNHGGNNTIPGSGKARLYLWGSDQFIWDSDFVNNLSGTTNRAIAMTMEQCFSGGFIDDFAPQTYSGTQKRVIATAATADQSSVGNDFSAAWIAGVSGPANFPLNNGNGDQLISYAEDFYYARAHDLSALGSNPLESPQTSGGSRKDNLTLGISSCSLCSGVVAVSGVTPRDLSSPADGLYEDVNGNGQFNKADAAFFFTNMESIASGEPTCAFDFNANGRIDFGDIVQLYTIAPA